MKKNVWIFVLAMALLTSGCAQEAEKTAQSVPVTAEVLQEEQAAVQGGIPGDMAEMELGDYMAFVKEQSEAVWTSLENDILTQAEMNAISLEVSELWEAALNRCLAELESCLPEDEWVKLQAEQLVWTEEREKAVAEAGREVEGGSMHALTVNLEAARIAEERVLGLCELLGLNTLEVPETAE